MKRILCIFIVSMTLFSSLVFADSYEASGKVFQMNIMEDSNLDRDLSREELATILIRLAGKEHLTSSHNKSQYFRDVQGWSVPYIDLAREERYIVGVGNANFAPKAKVSYIDLLTVIMRLMEYEDNIDFRNYPDDFYSKAIEIGLANIYISFDTPVTRELAAKTVDRALDLKLKDSDLYLSSLANIGKLTSQPTVGNYDYTYPSLKEDYKNIKVENISFNSLIIGAFSGQLKGRDDFTNYRVKLLTRSDRELASVQVDKNGSFSIENFPIDIFTKNQGYKYTIHSPKGDKIQESNIN